MDKRTRMLQLEMWVEQKKEQEMEKHLDFFVELENRYAKWDGVGFQTYKEALEHFERELERLLTDSSLDRIRLEIAKRPERF